MRTILFLFILSLMACDTSKKEVINPVEEVIPLLEEIPEEIEIEKEYPIFKREDSQKRIKDKIENKEALFIHTFIPLCDNENQGIVPVNKSLGDGFNLRTNLYWGALYGMKTHFKKSKDWVFVSSEKDISPHIAERIIFKKTFPNKASVYLIADAYWGDKMSELLSDFFKSTSGAKKDKIENNKIGIYGNADLLIFNGHNGLMDTHSPLIESTDNQIREVGVIACISYSYFSEHLKAAKAYPTLMTTNLMAPEAYVMKAFINAWCMQKTEQEIHQAVGEAYHKYQKCGIRGAKRLFRTAWDSEE